MALDPITALFEAGKMAIERIWPDPNKRAEEIRKLKELEQSGDLAQMQAQVTLLQGQLNINIKEAEHKSVFVAGWRPFVGWVGGFGLAYAGILEPLMRFIAKLCGYAGDFPVIDTTLTMQVLLGMLGLGAMRSFDKSKNTQTDKI
jgi:hypothetical protein